MLTVCAAAVVRRRRRPAACRRQAGGRWLSLLSRCRKAADLWPELLKPHREKMHKQIKAKLKGHKTRTDQVICTALCAAKGISAAAAMEVWR